MPISLRLFFWASTLTWSQFIFAIPAPLSQKHLKGSEPPPPLMEPPSPQLGWRGINHETLTSKLNSPRLSLASGTSKGAAPIITREDPKVDPKDTKFKADPGATSYQTPPSNNKSPPSSQKKIGPCPYAAGQRVESCPKNKELSLIAGLFFADIPGYGGSGSYKYSPELSFGSELILNSLNLRENQKEKELYYRNIALRFLQLGGFVRWNFSFSESFFVKAAASYRYLETGMNGFKSTTNGDFDFSLATKAHYLVASSSFGNRYKFQNGITLGCEWIGVAVPISLKKSSSGEYNGSKDPELESTSQRLHKTFLKPHLQLLFLSLGRAF